MSGRRKATVGRHARAMSVLNVGPCFTCGCRSVCWFAGLGWDKVNHMGKALSDFDEPPCTRLKAVPTMPSGRVAAKIKPTRQASNANRQSHSTSAGSTHRHERSTDSD